MIASQQKIKDELSADFSDGKLNVNHHLYEETIHASGNNLFKEASIVLKKLYAFCARESFVINLYPNKDLQFAKTNKDKESK